MTKDSGITEELPAVNEEESDRDNLLPEVNAHLDKLRLKLEKLENVTNDGWYQESGCVSWGGQEKKPLKWSWDGIIFAMYYIVNRVAINQSSNMALFFFDAFIKVV